MKYLRDNQIGDTIVEVILASAVLSVVLAGAFTITNKATRLSQAANERTIVSNLIQREAELLNFKHSQEGDLIWSQITTTDENLTFCDGGPQLKNGAFYTNQDDLSIVPVSMITASKVSDYDQTDFFNVWVEAVDDISGTQYTDFFIYACWEGIGGEGLQRSGAVVRLSR